MFLNYSIRVMVLYGVGTNVAALADSGTDSPHPIQSATFLGFGVENAGNAMSKGASGSAWGLEASYQMDSVSIGFRTFASGGQAPGTDYLRLSSGPLVRYTVRTDILVGLSIGYFSKSGRENDLSLTYESKGWDLMLDWQRRIPLATNADLHFGGYLIAQKGSSIAKDPSQQLALSTSHGVRDDGRTAGIKLGLSFKL